LRKIILILVVLFAVQNTAIGEDKNLNSILDQVQSTYERINDFHAKFTQEATIRSLNQVQRADGEVWLKKPGKMRWNYYRPNKEEIVSDGSKIWFYNQEEKQVVESSLIEVMDTPTTTTLLSGLGNIKEQFNARFSDSAFADQDGSYLVDLLPRGNSAEEEYNKVTIAVDRKSMLVNTIYLYDPFGNLTKVNLHDIKINKGVSDSLFNFKVPKGVELIKAPSVKQ
jgi:outer membrane lipoprotein carrier protein